MGLFIVFIIIIIYVALSQSVKQSNNQNRRGNNPAMDPQMNRQQAQQQLKNRLAEKYQSAAAEEMSAMEVIEPMEFTYDIPQSDNMKKVQELMVTGFSGNLNFERDFVAEGIEMLNRFELQ